MSRGARSLPWLPHLLPTLPCQGQGGPVLAVSHSSNPSLDYLQGSSWATVQDDLNVLGPPSLQPRGPGSVASPRASSQSLASRCPFSEPGTGLGA